MIKLYSSKSFCEQAAEVLNLSQAHRHSTSILDSIAPEQAFNNVLNKDSYCSLSSSLSYSSLSLVESSSSDSCSSSFKQECTFNPEPATANDSNKGATLSFVKLIGKKHNIELTRQAKKKKPSKKNQNKYDERIRLSKELIKFVIKKNSAEFNKLFFDQDQLIDESMNETCMELVRSDVDYELAESDSHITYSWENSYLLTASVETYLLNMDTWNPGNTLRRPSRANKRVKLKKLMHNDNIVAHCKSHATSNSYRKNLGLTASSLTKSTSRLYVKYNVYSKVRHLFDNFVCKLERTQRVYAPFMVDKRHPLDAVTVKVNKTVHRQIALADSKRSKHLVEADTDLAVVVNNSLTHGRVNNELNQTYDDMYVEFLISLQHREITPDDYEYLSRLDELIKKKTVNDNILKNLTSQLVDKALLTRLDGEQEVCGICLDGYVIGQLLKYLPCGHKFHNDCIESWLGNQSTNCPLDNLPVDQIGSGSANDSLNIEHEIKSVVNSMLDQIDSDSIEAEVKQCMETILSTLDGGINLKKLPV